MVALGFAFSFAGLFSAASVPLLPAPFALFAAPFAAAFAASFSFIPLIAARLGTFSAIASFSPILAASIAVEAPPPAALSGGASAVSFSVFSAIF